MRPNEAKFNRALDQAIKRCERANWIRRCERNLGRIKIKQADKRFREVFQQ